MRSTLPSRGACRKIAAATAVTLVASAIGARAAEPTVADLLRRTDDLLRGDSSQGRVVMRVKTARWQRELTMEVHSLGTEKTLVRILSPAKERGTATLKVENEIWNYLPKVDRTIKVPSSMMSGSWMGSHFSNDDLVRQSRFEDDFDCEFRERPAVDGGGHWLIGCIPRPDAPIVWGEVVVRVRAEDELVDEVDYYDEDRNLVRTMLYTDVKLLDGRRLPTRMRMVPADEPDEFTEMVYEDLRFDVVIEDRTFTLRALRR